jgi:phosphoesterase RecJ-like protein
MKKNDQQLEKIAKLIEESRNFLITAHQKPDGDAIGSLLALYLALTQAGKTVIPCLTDPVPQNLLFLPESGSIVFASDLASGRSPTLPQDTILIVLDCNELQRTGILPFLPAHLFETAVVLDHHIARPEPLSEFAGIFSKPPLLYIDTEAFSTAALVYWLLETMNRPLTPEIATNIYTGVVTDTGSFCHSNTNADALEMAAALVRAGANPHRISSQLFQQYPVSRHRLLAMALNTLELEYNGKVGFMYVSPEMFLQSGANEEDAHDFVGCLRSIDTVELAIFIKETSNGQSNVSLRSKSYFNAAELAASFGGGGHFHAAGFRMNRPIAEIKGMILAKLADVTWQ